jgi:hypothetical protein
MPWSTSTGSPSLSRSFAPGVAATGTILVAVNANENMGHGDLVDSRGGIIGLLAAFEGKNGEKRAALKKLTEKTPYQRWLDEAPKRKADREEILKTLAQVQPPADVARLRKEMVDAERDAGEQFKKTRTTTASARSRCSSSPTTCAPS